MKYMNLINYKSNAYKIQDSKTNSDSIWIFKNKIKKIK